MGDDQVALTIDKQTEKWEAMDQEEHVSNAIEEQQKSERQKKKQRQKAKRKKAGREEGREKGREEEEAR